MCAKLIMSINYTRMKCLSPLLTYIANNMKKKKTSKFMIIMLNTLKRTMKSLSNNKPIHRRNEHIRHLPSAVNSKLMINSRAK